MSNQINGATTTTWTKAIMFERVKAIAAKQFPIDKEMCQMQRNMALAARQARVKKLMDELKGLTVEQQTYCLQQWEYKL